LHNSEEGSGKTVTIICINNNNNSISVYFNYAINFRPILGRTITNNRQCQVCYTYEIANIFKNTIFILCVNRLMNIIIKSIINKWH